MLPQEGRVGSWRRMQLTVVIATVIWAQICLIADETYQ